MDKKFLVSCNKLSGNSEISAESEENKSDIKVFNWYCNGQLTAVITADYTHQTVEVQNLVNDSYYLPFAPDIKPSFSQWQAILKSHCPSEHNAFIDQFLANIGLDHYDVLEIIKKTHGKVHHSSCTIELVEE